MNKVTKGVLIGGCVGAGVAAVQVSAVAPPPSALGGNGQVGSTNGPDGEGQAVAPSVPPEAESSSPSPAIWGSRIAKVAMGAAVVGGAVGFALDRKARRRAREASTSARVRRLAAAGWTGAATELRPRAEEMVHRARHAAEVAAPHLEHATDVARSQARHAADVAAPKLEHAAEIARVRARHAAEVAAPRLEHAAEVARSQARHAVELAAAARR